MTLETLEHYLDGALPADEARAIESAAAADGVLAARIQRLRSQRALRQAALSTYTPTEAESRALIASTLAECRPAVVGRIGFKWLRTVGAVAAMLVIAATSFYAGRATSPATQAAVNNPQSDDKEYIVYLPGETEPHRFATEDATKDFIARYQEEQQAQEDGLASTGGVL
jgi:anti-sigma factor RsiW